jgi:hypothetical protein
MRRAGVARRDAAVTGDPPLGAVPEAVRTLLERTLPTAEFQRLLAIPPTDAERDDTHALVRWFTRRYPTPAERFAYIRRARARRWGSAPRQR